MEAALERAKAVIAEQSLLQLTLQDQQLLVTALLEQKVAEPTSHLQDLTKEYATRVQS